MEAPKVLDVGQCEADHGSIRRLVESIGGRVIRAHTAREAVELAAREHPKLVLVNRVLDRDGDDGVRLIGELVESAAEGTSVMLVSNYPDYQAKAVELGAVPGFGKSSLRDPLVRDKLATALGLG